MEDEIIRKYFCNFCTNKRKCNCFKLLEEKNGEEYIYKCVNYISDRTINKKIKPFDYKINGNKKR